MRIAACRTAFAGALLALCLVSQAGAQAVLIGDVEYVRGAGAAQRGSEAPRVLGAGSAVEQGEVLTIGANSYAVVKLNDGTRMTLRPNTTMRIDEFVLDQPGKSDSLVMNLLKGGLRVVTGAISKRGTAARLSTPTATVGIRGTDFDARLCADDCRAENRRPVPLAQASVQTLLPASARVVQMQGALSALSENGERRLVQAGGPAYRGEVLETAPGSQAVLVFRDETRVTVQGGTRFKIEDFVYDSKTPEEGRVSLGLLKGGIRALTGLIAKARPGSVRFYTPTATVGIRGTGIDMSCEGSCAGEAPGGPTDGFFILTWQGEVGVSSAAAPTEILIVPIGSAARLGAGELRPILMREIPEFINNNPAVRPDRIDIDINRLFGLTRKDDGEDGLYVYLRDGHLAVSRDGQSIDIGRGEALFAGLSGNTLTRLEAVPRFIQTDPTPRPERTSDARGTQLLQMLSLGLRARSNLSCRP